MSRPPWSKLLSWARLTYPSGPTFVQVTVPAGVVWILRDMDFVARGAATQYFRVWIVHTPPPLTGTSLLVDLFSYSGPDSSVGVPVAWRGRQVMNAGDVLTVDLGSFDPPSHELNVHISGYELQAP
jgi:hypothetical protein